MNSKKILTKKKIKLTWYTPDQVFGPYRKSKEFQRGYREETMRLKLALAIKKAREAKHMTQTAVAKRASMPQSVVARLESGEHSVSVDTLGRVANALGAQIALVKDSK